MASNTEKIPGRGMTLVTFGWIAYFLAYFGTFALGLILPSMSADLGFGIEVSGNLSSINFLVKTIVYIPLALWAAQANPRLFLGIVYVIMGLSLIFQGIATNVPLLYIGRALMAMSSSGLAAPMALVKMNWVPTSRLSTINGLDSAIQTFGQLVATAATAYLLVMLSGWRNLLIIAGVLGVALGIAWFVCFKENPAVGPIRPPEKKPFLDPLKGALKHKTVWLLALGWPGTTLVWIAFTTFWPTYAIQNLGLTLEQSGVVMGLIPAASIVASLTAPKLANIIGYDKLMLWPWGFILPVAYFLSLTTSNVILLGIYFFIAGYGAFAFVPVALTMLYKLPGTNPGITSASISFVLTLTSIGGTLAGIIVGQLAGSADELYFALAICCLSPLLWGVLTLFVPELGRKAMEKAAKEKQAAN